MGKKLESKCKPQDISNMSYQFIPYPKVVLPRYENENEGQNVERIPEHDKYDTELCTGYIQYEVNLESSLSLQEEKICIYGSSIRGVIVKNAQIISLSYPSPIKEWTIQTDKNCKYEAKDYLDIQHNPKQWDYCEAMFGTAKEKKKCKGRISFEDLKFKIFTEEVSLFGPQIEKENRYFVKNDKLGVRVKGRKFYWMKDRAEFPDSNKNPKTAKEVHYISDTEQVKFEGRINFWNLHKDELGLLLLALKPDDQAKEQIGGLKAQGFGKVTIKITALKLVDFSKMRCFLEGRCKEESTWIEKKEAIKDYTKDFMNKRAEIIQSMETLYKKKGKIQEDAEKIFDIFIKSRTIELKQDELKQKSVAELKEIFDGTVEEAIKEIESKGDK